MLAIWEAQIVKKSS